MLTNFFIQYKNLYIIIIMLNIFKLKKKDLNVNTLDNEGDYIRETRYYLPANKE
jgi:hypothetical protein